ncbi:MAG: hypothetical protein FWG46_08985 [Treponema sp.]|nr:hypothetical protein [Treponema sp.]
MKRLSCLILALSLLLLPLCLISAQEEAPSGGASPAAASGESSSGAGEAAASGGGEGSFLSQLIALLAPIGALFGKTTGIRIGGTTMTGIATLAGAKILHNKIPSWLKWVLYLAGGTMFTGSGANIAQLIMRNISF